MMTVQQFIDKATAQKQDISHFNVYALAPEQMQMHLDGDCICCGDSQPEIHPIEEVVDTGECFHINVIGYAQSLFCEGCEMMLPAEVLLKHGVISQSKHDELCDDEDDDLPF